MRVLTTTICYPTVDHPEQGVFVQRRAAALAGQPGVDLQVVAPQLYCPLLRRTQAAPDQSEPIPATYPPMLSPPVLGWATDGLAFAHALERHIQAHGGASRYDLIDAHFVYPDGVGAWLAGRKLGIPVAVTVRGKIVSLSRRAIRRAQIARMLRGVDARIAVSRSLVGWVHRVGGSDLHVDVVPNAIDTEVFQVMDRDNARSQLGWSPEAKYLLAVGHLQRVKGFDRIVSVMPEIRARLGDVRLVLAGSGRGEWGFRHRLRGLIAACGGTPAVSYVGAVNPERLNLMYNAAEVFVNVSRSEGWNNAINEAMAAGTPVVAFNVGGNTEQICSSQLGRIVPEGNLRALADAVCDVLTSKWNRTLIAAHGGARTWSQVGREVRRIFHGVLAARAAAPADTNTATLFNRPMAEADVMDARPSLPALGGNR